MRVYIAGPYTKGNVEENVRRAVQAGTTLLQAGYMPYIPHLSHFWHQLAPQDYEVWMALDFAFLDVCQALIRLPGESPGADREVARAKERGIPVYEGTDELLWAADWQGESEGVSDGTNV